MDRKPRWLLQAFYGGAWRDLFGSDYRSELVDYVNKCSESLQIRIIDTTEEEVTKKHGRRRD